MTDARIEGRLPGRLQATFWPGAPVPSAGHLALWGLLDAELDDAVAALGFDPARGAALPTVLPRTARAHRRVSAAEVPARLLPVVAATRRLVALPPAEQWPAWGRPADSVLAWSTAAKLACELVASGCLVPRMRAAGDRAVASWACAPGADRRVGELAAGMPPAAHALVSDEEPGAIWPAEQLVRDYLDAVADGCARAAGTGAGGVGHLAGAWLTALRGDDPLLDLPAGREDVVDELAGWSAPLLAASQHAAAQLCLRLELPTEDDDDADSTWRVEYLLQDADDASLFVPAEDVWAHAGDQLPLGTRQVRDAQESLVRGLAEAARLFPPIAGSLDQAAPIEHHLDAHDAGALLEAAGTLAAAGIGVWLPAELTADGQRRLRARLRARTSTPAPGNEREGGLDGDSLGAFSWEAALGDEVIPAEEFARIVALKQPLVRWRGRWVRVDPDEATAVAERVGAEESATGADVLAAALTGEHDLDGHGPVEVEADGALAQLVQQLRDGAQQEPRLDGIDAELRPYQQRGVAWLQTLAEFGLGGILADDMGLGKTLQSTALLADRSGDRPHLVVCPVSVVSNWERELARFAPGLEVVRHHGPERADTPDAFPPGAVVVTTYALLRLDAPLLGSLDWDLVVFDEAQQLKNHATKVARAARQLPARLRLALTGTPVENRLAELWAILDLTTPGLLGHFAGFRARFAAPIERWQDPQATAQLRALTGPFVLRRTKADPTIAPELPDKTELLVSGQLTREQATLYQAAVDDTFAEDLGEGIERRGRILKLLTGLKQICNHPAQYLGERGPLVGRSGKLDRSVELLAEVVDAGDRALVFTQYRQMGGLLADHLRATLGLPDVPFLHGGVSRTERERMVAAFQQDETAPPVLLVSLKAGGTGLNLTRATHVLHYDRWWNPAVEDQATDRAYRIGQHRAVLVHKLVTAGTLEERIATLIDDKRQLADAVLGEGEAWLTELDDDALHELVRLRDDAADDDPADDDPAAADSDGGVDVEVAS